MFFVIKYDKKKDLLMKYIRCRIILKKYNKVKL